MKCPVSKPRALAGLMGGAVVLLSPLASAAVIEFAWSGSFTMLTIYGAALMNSSLDAKTANQFQTPISGTLTYDSSAGTGSLTVVPFDWQNQPPDLPSEIHSVQFERIGNGFGGSGTLALGNFLYNWNGSNNISASIVWDMAGLLNAVDAGLSVGDSLAGVGAVPASDGTWTNHNGGTYLNQGPVPVATTTYDTTLAPGCTEQDCNNVMPSGTLPLIEDTAYNEYKSTPGTDVYGIGGTPVMEGPWLHKSYNIDIASMSVTQVSNVPLPAAGWLFGVGLMCLGAASQGRRSR